MNRPPHPEDYRPCNTMPEFREGFAARAKGDFCSPYSPDSVATQAFDRGLDYAMRLNRYEKAGE